MLLGFKKSFTLISGVKLNITNRAAGLSASAHGFSVRMRAKGCSRRPAISRKQTTRQGTGFIGGLITAFIVIAVIAAIVR